MLQPLKPGPFLVLFLLFQVSLIRFGLANLCQEEAFDQRRPNRILFLSHWERMNPGVRLNVDDADKVLIIGGGPGGIAAARALSDAEVPFLGIERAQNLGGVWTQLGRGAPGFDGLTTISSKRFTRFKDWSYKDAAEAWEWGTGRSFGKIKRGYLTAEQVGIYLQTYARHFGVQDHYKFETEIEELQVVDVRLSDHFTGDPRDLHEPYRILARFKNSRQVRLFRFAILSSGFQRIPFLPDEQVSEIRSTLGIPVYHSMDLGSAEDFKSFRDKRVVIVGGGQTALDFANRIALEGGHPVLSLRRGYHYIPRYVGFQTADDFAELSSLLQIPVWLRRVAFAPLVRMIVGDLSKYGFPKPDHALLDTQPTLVPDGFLERVKNGMIEVQGGILQIGQAGLRSLTLESHLDPKGKITVRNPDAVIYATGFRHDRVPYIDSTNQTSGFPSKSDGTLDLNEMHVAFTDPRVPALVMGRFETDGSAFPILEAQAGLIETVLRDPQRNLAILDGHIRVGRFNLQGGLYRLRSNRSEIGVDHTRYRRTLLRLADYLKADAMMDALIRSESGE